ncbi:hypothetical protein HOE67_00185 [Candidatus Peregrinibacteria bacterium]|nr:hypothetical protein [Candidatus Peregrinibacteria bacterium]MBT4055511.1 hypothetical protein [Candidatus Peregrinibacteria bacterium]
MQKKILKRLKEKHVPDARTHEGKSMGRIKDKAEEVGNELIPPFLLDAGINFAAGEDADIDASRSKYGSNIKIVLDKLGDSPEEAAALLKEIYDDPQMGFWEYQPIVAACFDKSLEKKNGLFEFRNALTAQELPMPAELQNVYWARMVEDCYTTGQYDLAIYMYDSAKASGNPVLRGMSYYAMKSYLELQDKDPENLGKAIDVVVDNIEQFEGTKWEEELWEKILPLYREHRARFDEHPNLAKIDVPKRIFKKALAENPGDIDAHLTFIYLLWPKKKEKRGKGRELFPLAEFKTALGAVDPESINAKAKRELTELHKEALNYLMASNRLKEASELMTELPWFDQDPELLGIYFKLLTHKAISTQGTVTTASALRVPGMDEEERDAVILEARQRHRMETHQNAHIGEVLATHLQDHGVIREKLNAVNSRKAFLSKELHELINDMGAVLSDNHLRSQIEANSNEEYPIRSQLLRSLGVSSMRFGVTERGIHVYLTTCVSETRKTNFVSELRFDKNFNLVEPDETMLMNAGDVNQRMAFLMLRAGAYQELLNICMDTEDTALDNIFYEDNPAFTEFTRRFESYGDAMSCPREDVLSLVEQNTATKELVEELLGGSYMEWAEAYEIDFMGLIERYKEEIDSKRDLDDPAYQYIMRVDPDSPLAYSAGAKTVTMFNSQKGAEILAEKGVSPDMIAKLGFPKTEKNNFVGYFEIMLEIDGEQKIISVVLDKNGNAVIFGIGEEDPLYKTLHCAVLEAFALKVVPEYRPFTRLFLGMTDEELAADSEVSDLERATTFTKRSPEIASQRVARTKRRAAASAVAGGEGRKRRRTPKTKLALLDETQGMFSRLELAERDISKWKLCFVVKGGEEKGRYVDVQGIFESINGANHVDIEILKMLYGKELSGLEKEAIIKKGGKQLYPTFDLPEELHNFLRKKLRVRLNKGGVLYRLPLEAKRTEKEGIIVEEREDGFYELRPLMESKGKKIRGRKPKNSRRIERDGKKYNEKKIPVEAKIKIGGKTYFLVVWKMSGRNRKFFDEDSTIKLNKESQEFLHAIIYDKKTGVIVQLTTAGPTAKQPNGEYLDLHSRAFANMSKKKAPPAAFLDARGAKKLRELVKEGKVVPEDLAVEFLEMVVHTGYRQGEFATLGVMLDTPGKIEKFIVTKMVNGVTGQPRNLKERLKEILSATSEEELPDDTEEVIDALGKGTETTTPVSDPAPVDDDDADDDEADFDADSDSDSEVDEPAPDDDEVDDDEVDDEEEPEADELDFEPDSKPAPKDEEEPDTSPRLEPKRPPPRRKASPPQSTTVLERGKTPDFFRQMMEDTDD